MRRGSWGNIWTSCEGSNRRMEKNHNREFHNLYPAYDAIRVIMPKIMRWDVACSRNGGRKKCIHVFILNT
jgi:hypothetical protein